MSKENLDQFIQKITDDEQLQTRIGEEIDADSLIALGAEHDCEFTADDLTASAELSDEELDGVAGGLVKGEPYRLGSMRDGHWTIMGRGKYGVTVGLNPLKDP